MATAAVLAKLSIMFILAAVTSNTASWFGVDLVDGSGVAAVTMDFRMRAVKFEFGLFVVVKAPDIPAIG